MRSSAKWRGAPRQPHALGGPQTSSTSVTWDPPNLNLLLIRCSGCVCVQVAGWETPSGGLHCVFATINTQAGDLELTEVCFSTSGVLCNLLSPSHAFHPLVSRERCVDWFHPPAVCPSTSVPRAWVPCPPEHTQPVGTTLPSTWTTLAGGRQFWTEPGSLYAVCSHSPHMKFLLWISSFPSPPWQGQPGLKPACPGLAFSLLFLLQCTSAAGEPGKLRLQGRTWGGRGAWAQLSIHRITWSLNLPTSALLAQWPGVCLFVFSSKKTTQDFKHLTSMCLLLLSEEPDETTK